MFFRKLVLDKRTQDFKGSVTLIFLLFTGPGYPLYWGSDRPEDVRGIVEKEEVRVGGLSTKG